MNDDKTAMDYKVCGGSVLHLVFGAQRRMLNNVILDAGVVLVLSVNVIIVRS